MKSEIETRTQELRDRIERHKNAQDYTFNGEFIKELLKDKLPTSTPQHIIFELQLAIQQQLKDLDQEESDICALSESIRSEIASEAAKTGNKPAYSGWKTSIRRTYSYDEDAILEAADSCGVDREDLYKTTRKFDPQLIPSKEMPKSLSEAILANRKVSKYSATVKWNSNEG